MLSSLYDAFNSTRPTLCRARHLKYENTVFLPHERAMQLRKNTLRSLHKEWKEESRLIYHACTKAERQISFILIYLSVHFIHFLSSTVKQEQRASKQHSVELALRHNGYSVQGPSQDLSTPPPQATPLKCASNPLRKGKGWSHIASVYWKWSHLHKGQSNSTLNDQTPVF